MEREEEKPKAFKVNDRRRFSSEGELKPEFQGSEEAAAASVPEPPPKVSEAPPRVDKSAHTDFHAHDAHGHAHDAHADHEQFAGHDLNAPHAPQGQAGATAEITFGTFLVGLSTQALMLLGDIPDPQTGKPEWDLVGAQQLIDIIGMLEQKTRGNLDRDEAQLIEAILYELRMKYVERAKGRG